RTYSICHSIPKPRLPFKMKPFHWKAPRRLTSVPSVVHTSAPCELLKTCANSPPNKSCRKTKHFAPGWNKKPKSSSKKAQRYTRRHSFWGAHARWRAGFGILPKRTFRDSPENFRNVYANV